MSSDSYTNQLYQSARDSLSLPVPTDIAQQHSEALISLIKSEIDNSVDGEISFRHYMELALYAPGFGYYVAGSAKLGEEGDFVTAPEISSFFSQALASSILPAIDSEQVILEVGAGRGRMAADILNFLKKNVIKLLIIYWGSIQLSISRNFFFPIFPTL